MNLRVLATGSRGNCYVLRDGGVCLLLDAGIDAGKIISGIGSSPSTVLGALITHQHNDHCKAVEMLWGHGIQSYGGIDIASAVPWVRTSSGAHRLAWYTCKAFPVDHCHPNGTPCPNYGWLIANENTGERMVYITDFCRLHNSLPNVHYWLIECNYMEELTGETPPFLVERIRRSHMSLDNLIKVFKANDMSACKQIILCHASRQRLDPERAVKAVQEATGKPTVVAVPGLVVHLSLTPY